MLHPLLATCLQVLAMTGGARFALLLAMDLIFIAAVYYFLLVGEAFARQRHGSTAAYPGTCSRLLLDTPAIDSVYPSLSTCRPLGGLAVPEAGPLLEGKREKETASISLTLCQGWSSAHRSASMLLIDRSVSALPARH